MYPRADGGPRLLGQGNEARLDDVRRALGTVDDVTAHPVFPDARDHLLKGLLPAAGGRTPHGDPTDPGHHVGDDIAVAALADHDAGVHPEDARDEKPAEKALVPTGKDDGFAFRDVVLYPFDAIADDPDCLRVQVADVIGRRGEEVFEDEEFEVFCGAHGFILLSPNPVSFKKKEHPPLRP
jgi:hypothetical protein